MNKIELQQAYNFIKADIERELQLADLSQDKNYIEAVKPFNQNLGGGNFLCAMALFSYIEFLGKIKYSNKKSNGDDFASKNFNDAFDELGTYYKTFRQSHNVYDIFRCGLVHEYYVKKNCEIAMLGDKNFNGLGIHKMVYYIIIVNLATDFLSSFDRYLKTL